MAVKCKTLRAIPAELLCYTEYHLADKQASDRPKAKQLRCKPKRINYAIISFIDQHPKIV